MPNSPTTHKPGRRTPSTARHTLTRTQRGYDNNWLRLSRLCLAEEPLCRHCRELGQRTRATVSDHIVPVQIRPDLRLVRSNVQSLCKPCHDGWKASLERELYGI